MPILTTIVKMLFFIASYDSDMLYTLSWMKEDYNAFGSIWTHLEGHRVVYSSVKLLIKYMKQNKTK